MISKVANLNLSKDAKCKTRQKRKKKEGGKYEFFIASPSVRIEKRCDELTRFSSASLLIEAAMSACSPPLFADNASKSSRRADKSKKSVIGRGAKREAVERRIEEELSRSSGRRRTVEDKEEEEQRGTTEHRRKKERERKQGERVNDDGMKESEKRLEGEEI